MVDTRVITTQYYGGPVTGQCYTNGIVPVVLHIGIVLYRRAIYTFSYTALTNQSVAGCGEPPPPWLSERAAMKRKNDELSRERKVRAPHPGAPIGHDKG